jgi:hypothetical protein
VKKHMRGGIDPIWPRLLLSGILVGLVTIPCAAQTPPPSPQNQPQPNLQPAAQEIVPVGAATAAVAQAPPALPGMTQSSSVGKSFGSAGRGLPGMPAGPPLNGAMGSQDPSSSFMSPPTIGPLFCDPALNIPCE